MKTSKRHQRRVIREEGCRAARRALDEVSRRRAPLADPGLRRMYPLG